MNRADTSELLVRMAELLGPNAPEEDDEAELRRDLMAGEPRAAAVALLDAVAAHVDLPAHVDREAFEFVASEVLAELGEQPGVLEQLTQRLHEPAVRTVLLDALAILGNPGAVPALAALARAQLPEPSLDTRAMVSLACALGCLEGAEALAAVEALLDRSGWPPEVEQELEIAREALTGESPEP